MKVTSNADSNKHMANKSSIGSNVDKQLETLNVNDLSATGSVIDQLTENEVCIQRDKRFLMNSHLILVRKSTLLEVIFF